MSDSKPKKQIPVWVSVVVILLMVGGGAWLTWTYLRGTFGQPETFGESDPPTAHMEDNRPPAAREGVRQLRPDVWIARAGGVSMMVRRQRDGGINFNPTYDRPFDPAQQSVLSARWRLPRDNAMAKAVGATTQQVEQLRKLPGGGGGGPAITTEPSDIDELKKLWTAYTAAADGADRDQAQAQLMTGLTDLGERRRDATKRALDERVTEVEAILTPEQLRKFQSVGR